MSRYTPSGKKEEVMKKFFKRFFTFVFFAIFAAEFGLVIAPMWQESPVCFLILFLPICVMALGAAWTTCFVD